MFKKASIKILVLVFIGLLILVVLIKVFKAKSGQGTFDPQIVNIDTSLVSSIIITPKGNEQGKVEIKKTSLGWEFESNGRTFKAEDNIVSTMLTELSKLKATRQAAKDEAKWEKYEVTDSLGVRVQVKSGDVTVSDFVIGKFSYQQPTNQYQRQGTMTSYIRLYDEAEVYSVNGFLNMIFNKGENDLRNKTLAKFNKENISRLVFTYPGDSSFVMSKEGPQWMVNGQMADSTAVAYYLNSFTNLNGSNFVNDKNGTMASHKIQVDAENASAVEISAYEVNTDDQYLIGSSINPDALFSAKAGGLFDRLFVSQSKFLVQ